MSDLSELLGKGRIWKLSWATLTSTTTVQNIYLIYFWSHQVSKGSWLMNASKMLQRVVLSPDFCISVFSSSMHCKCFSAWFWSVTNRSRQHKSASYKMFNFLFLLGNWFLIIHAVTDNTQIQRSRWIGAVPQWRYHTCVCKVTPRHIEKKKQEVSDVFKSNGLKFSKKSLSRRTERS